MRFLTLIVASSLCIAPASAQDDEFEGGPAAEERATGLTFLDEQTYRSIPLAATPLMGDLPAEVDMAGDFPVPGDQGDQPSCVGWAVAYALKSHQEKRERNWSLDSRDRLFSPAFIYNQIKLNNNCTGGSHFVDALNVLRRDGAATLTEFPYDPNSCAAMPSAIVKQNARTFAVADWRRINVQDEIEIKTQLAAGFPVMIGAMVGRNFKLLQPTQVFRSNPARNATGHAMVIVGYSNARNAFKVINSWGTDWGDGGFGWIGFAAFRAMAREGYVVQDIVANPTAVVETAVPERSGPTTAPWPRPEPVRVAQPSIGMGYPSIIHNQTVPSPNGPVPGMRILLSGRLQNAKGRQFQIMARFRFQNGSALNANYSEQAFRDISGLVATGTPVMPVGVEDAPIDGVVLTIPYYALNLQPSGGNNSYNLALNVIAYLNNQPVAQSAEVPFQVRW